MFEIINNDCRQSMQAREENSIDSIVTDPPYGLKFMGNEWDHGVPGVEFWAEALRVAKPGAYLLAFGGTRMVHRLAVAIEDAGWEIRDRLMWAFGKSMPKGDNLKAAYEPIILARKPGKSKLNLDDCRIGDDEVTVNTWVDGANVFGGGVGKEFEEIKHKGRYPKNLLMDEFISGRLNQDEGRKLDHLFYCPKANKKDRGEENNHPTVKPTDLMRYLCRLVTPPNGLILDPFNGSGSTGKAAVSEGFNYIGIEKDSDFCDISRLRIEQVCP